LHYGVPSLQEGEQADTSQQGGKAPKNPITGEPLTPVQNKDKEGYQATVLAGQSDETSARIMKQLDGQDGRPFGGRCHTRVSSSSTSTLLHACQCSPADACLERSAYCCQWSPRGPLRLHVPTGPQV
jgi:hypothetical protein